MTRNDDCDCGYCGRCVEQLHSEIDLERAGWHTPGYKDEDEHYDPEESY